MRDEVQPPVNQYRGKGEFPSKPIELIDKVPRQLNYQGYGAHLPTVSNPLTQPRSAWLRDR